MSSLSFKAHKKFAKNTFNDPDVATIATGEMPILKCAAMDFCLSDTHIVTAPIYVPATSKIDWPKTSECLLGTSVLSAKPFLLDYGRGVLAF